jgi:hypothetical protein
VVRGGMGRGGGNIFIVFQLHKASRVKKIEKKREKERKKERKKEEKNNFHPDNTIVTIGCLRRLRKTQD